MEPADCGVGRTDQQSDRIGGPDDDRPLARRPFLVTGHGDPQNPAAADKAKIKVWDLSTQKLAALSPPRTQRRLRGWVFRRGTLLASGDMAGNIRIWDFASRNLFAKQIAPQGRPIVYLAFDQLGTRLATAADEPDKKCVRVWEIDTGRELAILELALGVPNVVRYTPGRQAAGGCHERRRTVPLGFRNLQAPRHLAWRRQPGRPAGPRGRDHLRRPSC